MQASKHREIMSHAEVQFAPQRAKLGDKHNKELRQAQFRARQKHNSAAMLPAEAACYIAHAKALVTAKASSIAEAYDRFNEPVGREAESELEQFSAVTVAARMGAFRHHAALRAVRTAGSDSQVRGLLRGFERGLSEALSEGRAILNRQRVEIKNRPAAEPVKTKYVVDTCVFNWLADAVLNRSDLPSDGGFAITHIQVDEINDTEDSERRARLLLMHASLRCELLPTQTFVSDVSRMDHAILGDGKLFSLLRARLDAVNGKKENNVRDALTAEAAIANGYTLLTADKDLASAAREHGGGVILYKRPRR
jgi:hypothetical protein